MWANRQFNADWALNPSAYKNVSHEDVDWASLAQEWIKMKEVSATAAPPPPPTIASSSRAEKNEDKGEAPMDMDTDDKGPDAPSDNPIEVAAPWETWPGWQPQWGWNWPAGTQPVAGAKVPPAKAVFGFPAAYPAAETPPTIDYNHGAPSHQPVFWTGQTEGSEIADKDPELPKAFLRNRYTWKRDRDRERKDHSRDNGPVDQEEDSMETLDAAKRKQLPAWIREGLEKMEREKQRKLDKERMDRERDEQLRIQQEAEQEVLLKMNSVEAAKLLAKSKFDSDGSDSEAVKEEPTSPKIRKSRFHNPPIVEPPPAPKITTRPPRKEHRSPSPQLGPPKSREEILEDVMMKVRRTLTEILLDVTTSEISTIAREVYQKARSQAPAKRLGKSQAFASIVGKSGLGLGIYGSDGESESDDGEAPNKEQPDDSDQELEQEIERKKEIFAETEKEIEAQLEAEEERELVKEKEAATVSSDGESNDGVGQVDRKGEKSKSSPHSHGGKKEPKNQSPDRGNDRTRPSRRFSGSKIEPTRSGPVLVSEVKKKKRNYSNSDSSSSSRSSSRAKKSKRQKKRSSSSSSRSSRGSRASSDNSSVTDKGKRKPQVKKKADSDESESDDDRVSDSKKKPKHQDLDKRAKKIKKNDKTRKRVDDRSKRTRRSRSLSKDSNSRRRRSHSRDSRESDRRRRSRSRDRRRRSRESDLRRRRSRSKDSDYRRRRSRSRESFRKHGRKTSRSRDSEDNKMRRRGRSSSS